MDLLPIKVVFPSTRDYKKPVNVGRLFEPVQDVTAAFRRGLSERVERTKEAFAPAFKRWRDLPAVATVTLHPDARSKSFRPSEIFNDDTCPVIGTRGPGELLVSVTPNALDSVRQRLQGNTKIATSHISTIVDIEPFRPVVVPADANDPLRVSLARHKSDMANQAIDVAFEQIIRSAGKSTRAEMVNYGPGMKIYRVQGLGAQTRTVLEGEFANVQSITPFPRYGVVRTSANALRPMTDDAFASAIPGRQYGVVGLIDSGTDPSNSALQSWVQVRDEAWIPRDAQNNDHGTFVAGLLTNARRLNHGDSRFPDQGSQIVDVVAFDKDGTVDEYDLLRIIDSSLSKYPHVRVWNLSLALSGEPCQDCEVSELASALDFRAKQNNVLFVIASGNVSESPFRPWPPSDIEVDDRIRPPADAVRALTVGGLAHVDTANTMAKKEQPSPFARKGPGVAGTLKPDLCHYAGNIDAKGAYIQSGIISLDSRGFIAENVGTSFSAPLVSTIAAAASAELETDDEPLSMTQLKALLMHAAFVKAAPLDAEMVKHTGIGRLNSLSEILNCSQTSATVIMNVKVKPDILFEKSPFPIPQCLVKNGRLKGEVFMTVAADCPLDRRFAMEYCRTNVTATLGTLHASKKDKSGNPSYNRQVPPALAGMGDEGDDAGEDDVALSDALTERGFRWSPIKMYYRRFVSGPDLNWRLRVKLTNRAEHYDDSEQDVSILLTIKSGISSDLVYDDLVRQMQQLAWHVEDLQLKSRLRGGRGRR